MWWELVISILISVPITILIMIACVHLFMYLLKDEISKSDEFLENIKQEKRNEK